jgi:para-nitrobenzyl esterase
LLAISTPSPRTVARPLPLVNGIGKKPDPWVKSLGSVQGVIVDTPSGRIQGLQKRDIWQFRGIRYATAERFRAPVRVEGWDGVRDATDFGNIAPQNTSPTEAMLGAQDRPSGEDCLFLNVFTPAADGGARPVLVWIHGGGFSAGSGSVPWYDGTNLARRGDAVVVTINYRLGVLGFLHLAHLDPTLAGSGASGILDQVAALEWVRDNIEAYGGDPGNVTIFGESAGGMSVGTLLGTPGASGLFRGAIAQSGATAHVHQPEAAEWVAEQVLTELGLPPAAAVDGVLDAPVDAVLAAQAAVDARRQTPEGRDIGPPVGALTFQPVVDGSVLPEPPLDAVRGGSAAGVSLVAGSTRDEWNLFHLRSRAAGALDEARLRHRLASLVPEERVGDVIDAYRSRRPDADPDDVICAAMTDHVFRVPAIRLATAHAAHAPRVSMYRFDYASQMLGACHGIDVPFAFDNLDRRGVEILLGDLDESSHRLAGQTAGAWLAAARTGSPELDDLPWPAYDPDGGRLTALLDREVGVESDPHAALRELWDELAPVPTPGAVVD